jgi:hypothetical protein
VARHPLLRGAFRGTRMEGAVGRADGPLSDPSLRRSENALRCTSEKAYPCTRVNNGKHKEGWRRNAGNRTTLVALPRGTARPGPKRWAKRLGGPGRATRCGHRAL